MAGMKTLTLVVALLLLLAAGAVGSSRAEQASPGAEPTAQLSLPEPGQPLSSQDLAAIIAQKDPNSFLIDVRTPEEFRTGAIPTAINIPYDVLAMNLPTEDRSARIIVYCRSGARSGVAYQTLLDMGFENVYDFGSVRNWEGELVMPE
jgi:phage shock protein E